MKPAFAALALLALTACSPGPSQPKAEPVAPPNVVVILADDLGYGDIGANGGTIIQTPHIDALARDGVRLTDGYVSAAVCSPSRAGLYTGRYQERLGFEFNVAGRDDRIGLPTDQRTIADMMKAAGYSTGLVGKWHQGKQKEYHPLSRGFDEYYGMLAGGSVYIDSRVQGVEAWPPDRQPIGRTDANAIFDGFEKVDPPEYLTDVFARKAADFIDRHKDERFFLMLTPNTPHTPLQATAKYLDRYRHIEEPNKRIYVAMVASLDDMVGRSSRSFASMTWKKTPWSCFSPITDARATSTTPARTPLSTVSNAFTWTAVFACHSSSSGRRGCPKERHSNTRRLRSICSPRWPPPRVPPPRLKTA